MDGFKKNEKIIVIAATNLESKLDKAIKRPGRFDRIIRINNPDRLAREKLIRNYLNRTKYINNLNFDSIID